MARVQWSPFYVYNVSKCSPYTTYKNWSGFLRERFLKRLRNLRNFIRIRCHLHIPVFMIPDDSHARTRILAENAGF